MAPLSQVRDLLIPGVHAVAKECGRVLDMSVLFSDGALVVRDKDGEVMRLSREDIEQDLWKTEFGPRLRAALKKRGQKHAA